MDFRIAWRLCSLRLFIGLAATCALSCQSRNETRRSVQTPSLKAHPLPTMRGAKVSLTEGDVRALIETWLRAQNTGDFGAYEGLYAERFTGVKRVGDRKLSFNRASWMRDRARIFKSAMEVRARDINVRIMGVDGLVSLTQTFTQGRFKDEGPKQFVVVATPRGPKIAREEMVRSMVGQVTRSEWLVVEVHGENYVVAATDHLPTADGTFEALGSGDSFTHSGRTRISVGALGSRFSEWRGKSVYVYPGGRECGVRDLYVLGVGTAHFGMEDEWRGDLDHDGVVESPPLPVAERDRQGIFSEMVAGLLARCPGRVALPARGTEWTRVTGDVGLEAAWKAFHEHPLTKKTQTDFGLYREHSGHWLDQAKKAGALFEGPTGRRVIVLGASVEGRACDDFSGALYLIFETRDGKLTFLGTTPGMPEVAVAADSGSLPVLAAKYWTTAPLGERYRQSDELDLGYRDCDC